MRLSAGLCTRHAATSYPTTTGRFSFSASSKAVCGATRGSGAHSSTSSSISYVWSAGHIWRRGGADEPRRSISHNFSSMWSIWAQGDIGRRRGTRTARLRSELDHFDNLISRIEGRWRNQGPFGTALIFLAKHQQTSHEHLGDP